MNQTTIVKIIIGLVAVLVLALCVWAEHTWPDTKDTLKLIENSAFLALAGLGIYHAATTGGGGSGGTDKGRSSLAFIGLVVVAALACALSGCALVSSKTPLGALTLQDAKGASALAQQNGDSAGQTCYDHIAAAITAAGEVPFTPGLLYLNELRRTAAASSAGLAQACAGVLPITVGL